MHPFLNHGGFHIFLREIEWYFDPNLPSYFVCVWGKVVFSTVTCLWYCYFWLTFDFLVLIMDAWHNDNVLQNALLLERDAPGVGVLLGRDGDLDGRRRRVDHSLFKLLLGLVDDKDHDHPDEGQLDCKHNQAHRGGIRISQNLDFNYVTIIGYL